MYFESYIVGNDPVGREFVDALAERARAGVRVRLVHDWLGTRSSRSLFAPLVAAGGHVRVFNPPRFAGRSDGLRAITARALRSTGASGS